MWTGIQACNHPVNNPVPLSLYVHLPWCIRKCPYCDFNSHEKNQDFDEQRYVAALLRDLDDEYPHCEDRKLSSIFFGGGTPSLFSADAIETIISSARERFGFDDTEITLEANPGTFEQDKFIGYREAGVNRLSIGIQSFDAGHLLALGRIHDEIQAARAVDTARHAGFDNINLDLMFGLPGQSLEQALSDVQSACDFAVSHISHYQLTIEPNTYFHKHTPVLPDSDLLWQMQNECQNVLAGHGYEQYEVSAYARECRQSRHNVNYWQFGDYIGIGAGAHGKISKTDETGGLVEIRRRWKHRQPQMYMQQSADTSAVSGENVLDHEAIVFEFLLNALRLKHGCSRKIFETHTGLAFATLRETLCVIDDSLVTLDEGGVCTTERGYLYLNEVLEQLV